MSDNNLLEGAPFISKQWFIHHDVPMDFTITLMRFDRQTSESMHEQFKLSKKQLKIANKKVIKLPGGLQVVLHQFILKDIESYFLPISGLVIDP